MQTWDEVEDAIRAAVDAVVAQKQDL